MKKVLRKSNLAAGILILVVVCLGIAFAGDVIVKEGVIEGVKFKSTGCTVIGTKAIAFGDNTEASGNYSTAMGGSTTASGIVSTAMGGSTIAIGIVSTAMGGNTTATGGWSTAMGYNSIASGDVSTAMGYAVTVGSANFTTSIGHSFINDVQDSFAVGFGQKDFSVVSGLVTVGDVGTNDANLYVTGWISGEDLIDR